MLSRSSNCQKRCVKQEGDFLVHSGGTRVPVSGHAKTFTSCLPCLQNRDNLTMVGTYMGGGGGCGGVPSRVVAQLRPVIPLTLRTSPFLGGCCYRSILLGAKAVSINCSRCTSMALSTELSRNSCRSQHCGHLTIPCLLTGHTASFDTCTQVENCWRTGTHYCWDGRPFGSAHHCDNKQNT